MKPAVQPKLLDQVRKKIRLKHYAISTEESYVHWIRRFIYFHGKRHPEGLREIEVEQFLSYLAQQRHLSASSQNQALSAIIFLYKEVLKMPLTAEIHSVRAKRRKRIPVVLSVDEVRAVLDQTEGVPYLLLSLLYGSGMRLRECVTLRVNQLDFAHGCIQIIDSKGSRDRLTILPNGIEHRLQAHLQRVKRLHEQDLARGYGKTVLPYAYYRKHRSASTDFRWQFVFPSRRLFRDATTGNEGRWSIHPGTLQRSLRVAVRKAGITKRVSAHTFRHSFATHLLESGCNIRRVQQLLGHKSVETTMMYTHVVDLRKAEVVSPLDRLLVKSGTDPARAGASGDGYRATESIRARNPLVSIPYSAPL